MRAEKDRGGPPRQGSRLRVAPPSSTTSIIAGRGDEPIPPDAEQLDEIQDRRLLELAGGYVRQALSVPDTLDAILKVIGEQAVELAHLRQRVEALERRPGRR